MSELNFSNPHGAYIVDDHQDVRHDVISVLRDGGSYTAAVDRAIAVVLAAIHGIDAEQITAVNEVTVYADTLIVSQGDTAGSLILWKLTAQATLADGTRLPHKTFHIRGGTGLNNALFAILARALSRHGV